MKKTIYLSLIACGAILLFFAGRYQGIASSHESLRQLKIYTNTYNSVKSIE
jgi:hypothetical protein